MSNKLYLSRRKTLLGIFLSVPILKLIVNDSSALSRISEDNLVIFKGWVLKNQDIEVLKNNDN